MARRIFALGALALGLVFAASPAAAQVNRFNYAVGAFGGIGGSPETDEFGEASFQGLFAVDIAHRTWFTVRAGQLEIDDTDETRAGDLSYLTLTGEYRMPTDFYESGLFLGLGFYDVESDDGVVTDDALGVTLGVTGDFQLTPRWSIVVELSGHWADLDDVQGFIMGHGGVVFRF
ncbi:MAG: hypothetical protein AAGN46_06945 [Acidobacteriota bacterium]